MLSPFRSGMKLNSTRGTSTNIYIAKFRNARKDGKKRNKCGKERKKWKKIALPSYCRGNEATSSNPLNAASRFLRASSFQLAPRDLHFASANILSCRRGKYSRYWEFASVRLNLSWPTMAWRTRGAYVDIAPPFGRRADTLSRTHVVDG